MVAKRPDQVHQRCHRPTRQLLWGGSAATAGQVAAINPCTDGQAHLVSTPFCSTADSGRRLPLRRPPRRSRRLRDLGCTAPAPRAIASRIQSIFARGCGARRIPLASPRFCARQSRTAPRRTTKRCAVEASADDARSPPHPPHPDYAAGRGLAIPEAGGWAVNAVRPVSSIGCRRTVKVSPQRLWWLCAGAVSLPKGRLRGLFSSPPPSPAPAPAVRAPRHRGVSRLRGGVTGSSGPGSQRQSVAPLPAGRAQSTTGTATRGGTPPCQPCGLGGGGGGTDRPGARTARPVRRPPSVPGLAGPGVPLPPPVMKDCRCRSHPWATHSSPPRPPVTAVAIHTVSGQGDVWQGGATRSRGGDSCWRGEPLTPNLLGPPPPPALPAPRLCASLPPAGGPGTRRRRRGHGSGRRGGNRGGVPPPPCRVVGTDVSSGGEAASEGLLPTQPAAISALRLGTRRGANRAYVAAGWGGRAGGVASAPWKQGCPSLLSPGAVAAAVEGRGEGGRRASGVWEGGGGRRERHTAFNCLSPTSRPVRCTQRVAVPARWEEGG